MTWSSRALPIYASALEYIMEAQQRTRRAFDNTVEAGISLILILWSSLIRY